MKRKPAGTSGRTWCKSRQTGWGEQIVAALRRQLGGTRFKAVIPIADALKVGNTPH